MLLTYHDSSSRFLFFFFSGGAVFVEYFTGFCAIRLKQSSSLLLIVFFRFNRKMAGMKGMKE